MFRILKYVIILAVLGLIGLTAYAFLGDYAPEQRPVDQPVTLTPG